LIFQTGTLRKLRYKTFKVTPISGQFGNKTKSVNSTLFKWLLSVLSPYPMLVCTDCKSEQNAFA